MGSSLLIGFVALVSILAWRFSLLSLSGAGAALVCGVLVGLGFGYRGLFLLGMFFISSSLLSNYKKKRKGYLTELHEKGSKRDWLQVAANGGIAAALGLAYFWWESPWMLVAFCISLASSNSDTWASELGTLSKHRPFSVRSFKRVEPGTSGAVSATGSAAGFFGAGTIALAAYFLFGLNSREVFLILGFGFLGMIVDTILGAFIQAGYRCRVCGRVVEKRHHCGEASHLTKGKGWLQNDGVNFISCLLAVILGIITYV
jgi:uncharacterized protein (TIGR00297 family)